MGISSSFLEQPRDEARDKEKETRDLKKLTKKEDDDTEDGDIHKPMTGSPKLRAMTKSFNDVYGIRQEFDIRVSIFLHRENVRNASERHD